MSRPIPEGIFLGCLIGQAVGDALGAPYEGVPADYVYYVHGPIHELLARPSDAPRRTTDRSASWGTACPRTSRW